RRGGGLGIRDRPPLPPRAGGVLADRLRLAGPGAYPQPVLPVPGPPGGRRPALHPPTRGRAGPAAAADLARLAQLGPGVPQADPAADRPRSLRRRPSRRFHRRGAFAAGLRLLVQAEPAPARGG